MTGKEAVQFVLPGFSEEEIEEINQTQFPFEEVKRRPFLGLPQDRRLLPVDIERKPLWDED